jgi:hypothetical protein
MGIFKESLPKFVQKQIKQRQKVLSSGNNKPGRSNNFFTYTVNKQCQLRMASMVDLVSKDLLDLSSKSTKGTLIEKDLLGSGLAATYVLDGGIPVKPFKKDKEGKTKMSALNIKRRGFGKHSLGTAYGDPLIRSDAKDGYGIVPMPGIIDMNIRTKSAYGSLREAKINFVCHNLRQLELLELLYMRPGFPIVLEWSWSPYIDNNGIKQDAPSWLTDKQNFWEQGYNQTQIQQEIINRKQNTGGNYDGILGYCKNFSYTARPDGGFDCTTELIAMGEVLDSIKGNMAYGANGERIPKIMEVVEHLLYYASDIVIVEEEEEDDDDNITVNKVMMDQATAESVGVWGHLNPLNRAAELSNNPWWQKTFTSDWDRASAKKEDWMTRFDKSMLTPLGIKRNIHIFGKDSNPYYEFWQDYPTLIALVGGNPAAMGRFGEQSEIMSGAAVGEFEGCQDEGYIRLDAFCTLINAHCLDVAVDEALQDKKDSVNPDERLVAIQTMNWISATNEYKPFLFNSYKPQMHILGALAYKDKSMDPYTCLLPEQRPAFNNSVPNLGWEYIIPPFNYFGYFGGKSNLSTTGPSAHPPMVGPDSKQLFEAEYRSHWMDKEKYPEADPIINLEVAAKAHYQTIGAIQISLKMLWTIIHDEWKKNVDREDDTANEFSIGKVFKTLLKKINKATGDNIKLGLATHHELPHVVNIIDLNSPIDKEKMDYEKDIFEIKVQSNDTQVRDFGMTTSVPSNLSSTIAVSAMNPDNAESLDSVTFAAINRGIRNRLFLKPENEYEEATNAERERKCDRVKFQIEQWKASFFIDSDYQGLIATCKYKDDDSFKSKRSSAVSNMNKLHNLSDSLLGKYIDLDDDQCGYFMDNPPSGTPIPLKLTLNMDGLGGMVIGNLFKVPKSRLPKHYRNNKIIFLITEEDQKITSGQDWTTSITGMMQLFPGTNTGKTKICRVDSGDFLADSIHTIYTADAPDGWTGDHTSYPPGTLQKLYDYQCDRCRSGDPDRYVSFEEWNGGARGYSDEQETGDDLTTNPLDYAQLIPAGTLYVANPYGMGYGGVDQSDDITDEGWNWFTTKCPQDGYANPYTNPNCDLLFFDKGKDCGEDSYYSEGIDGCETLEERNARMEQDLPSIIEVIETHRATAEFVKLAEYNGYIVYAKRYTDGKIQSSFSFYDDDYNLTDEAPKALAEKIWNREQGKYAHPDYDSTPSYGGFDYDQIAYTKAVDDAGERRDWWNKPYSEYGNMSNIPLTIKVCSAPETGEFSIENTGEVWGDTYDDPGYLNKNHYNRFFNEGIPWEEDWTKYPYKDIKTKIDKM